MAAAGYQKLPSPLANIIQQPPVVGGLEEDQLFLIFQLLFRLSDFPGVTDRAHLEINYPYC